MSSSSPLASSHNPSVSPNNHSSLSDGDEHELSDVFLTDDEGYEIPAEGFRDTHHSYDGANDAEPSTAARPSTASDKDFEIARRIDYRTVRIEVPDREPLETIYLRKPAQKGKQQEDKATIMAYKFERDGPSIKKCPITPAAMEFVPAGEDTLACIEVGLIHGDDPKKFKATVGGATGTGVKPIQTQAEMYGKAEPRGTDMMRVFLRRTAFINTTAPKFYAGCLPGPDGRLEMRLISADFIYFYPEVWAAGDNFDPNTRMNQRAAKVMVIKACRELAALDAVQAPSEGITITKDRIDKIKAAKPLEVTEDEHLVALLGLQLNMFEICNDGGYLDVMINTAENSHPDFRFSRATKTQGANAFMSFNEPLSDEDASSLVQELQTTFPDMKVPSLVLLKRIHVVLCKPLGDKSDEIHIGSQLQMRGLVTFLETCDFLLPHEDLLSDKDFEDKVVLQALGITKIHMRNTKIETFQPSFNAEETAGDEDDATSAHGKGKKRNKGKGKGLSQEEMYKLLTAVCKILDDVRQAATDSAEAVVDRHGGLLRYASVSALLNQVARTVDVESFKIMVMQVAAFDANILKNAHRDHIAIIGDISKYLNTVREVCLPKDEE